MYNILSQDRWTAITAEKVKINVDIDGEYEVKAYRQNDTLGEVVGIYSRPSSIAGIMEQIVQSGLTPFAMPREDDL